MKKLTKHFIIILTAALCVSGCGLKRDVKFSGKTMGTTYHITIVSGYFQNLEDLKKDVDKKLRAINRSMSIFSATSEISRFNKFHSTKPFPVSEDFFKVMKTGKLIYEDSGGAWDATIAPLVNLWGFGPKKQKLMVPNQDQVDACMKKIGFNRIEILATSFLKKDNPMVTIDLGSIAKGYGVDQVAAVIKSKGFDNFLVEIGGEVFAQGLRDDGKHWRIGINTPDRNASFDQVYKAVSIINMAMATSGDYRNYFEAGGQFFSHVFDPKTGFPVKNGVVSVSVIAPACGYADGLATAIMVMGASSGIDLVNKLPHVECMVVKRDKKNKFINFYSKGFSKYQ